MSTNKKDRTPRTLVEAIRYFKDEQTCIDFLAAIRWPDGVKCPTCGNEKVGYLANQGRWQCSKKHPKRQFSVKVGTIFEDSPVGLDKWLPAMWLIVSCKNGISSYEIGRGIGVTQQTGWFMLQRLRLALRRESFEKFGGEVEADETYIGGKARNMHRHKWNKIREERAKGRTHAGRAVVMGVLKRHGQIHIAHIPDVTKRTLQDQVKAHVEPGTQVYTDELASYTGLSKQYVHNVINHAEEYVNGHIHTNGIENFWSLLKRTIRGTYVSVEPFHLHRYLTEQAYRFNERRNARGDAGRFVEALRTVVGRRLTYEQLIGGGAAGPPIAAPA